MHSTGQAFAAQVRLVRGEGISFAAQIIGLQRVRLAAGEACGQLRLARERGQRAVLRAARGSGRKCAEASVRTGMAWSSFVCWLVILIRAGSSEVGARSPGADVGIAFVCMS